MDMSSLFHKVYLRLFEPGYLEPFEYSKYSQNGEDGIIEEIFRRVGTSSRFGVEFGVEDGKECNSRLLKEKGWKILQMDGNENNPNEIKKEFITAENINRLFRKYKVPLDLDFLCIDIDFNDYYVWKSLDKKYRPRLVVLEYNSSIPPHLSKAVKYDAYRAWDYTNYFGGSLLAMYRVARKKGYSLVYCEKRGVNAFFVRDDLLRNLEAKIPSVAYRGPGYGTLEKETWVGHKKSKEAMVEVAQDS